MKKLMFVLLIMVIVFMPLKGQKNSVPTDLPKYTYCEIFTQTSATDKNNMSTNVDIKMNDGNNIQSFSKFTYKDPSITPTVFTDIIKTLNDMAKVGWEVVQVYSVINSASPFPTYSYHYLLRKRIQ